VTYYDIDWRLNVSTSDNMWIWEKSIADWMKTLLKSKVVPKIH